MMYRLTIVCLFAAVAATSLFAQQKKDTVVVKKAIPFSDSLRLRARDTMYVVNDSITKVERYSYDTTYAVDSTKYIRNSRLGGYGLAHGVFNTAAFKGVPNVPTCCPEYGNSFDPGIELGFLGNFRVADSLHVSVRLGVNNSWATFNDTETTTVLKPTPREGSFEHTLNTSITSIRFAPHVQYYFSKKLSATLGLSFGVDIASKFDQQEQVISPLGAVFVDSKKSVRNVFSGSIDGLNSITFSPNIGVAYDLPLNKSNSIVLTPELWYELLLPGVVSGVNWTTHSIKAGISIGFDANTYQRVPEIMERKETVQTTTPRVIVKTNIPVVEPTIDPPKVPLLEVPPEIVYKADIVFNDKAKALIFDSTRSAFDTVNVTMKGQISRYIQPLLPFVFFDDNSAVVPERYLLQEYEGAQPRANPAVVRDFALENYYNMLNLIGQRLVAKPDAVITITGCNNNTGKEKGNTKLSLQRAQVIRTYFNKAFGIDTNRLLVQIRNLPEKPSTQTGKDAKDGLAENRRVEISSEDWEIVKWIDISDTTYGSSLENVWATPTVFPTKGIASRTVTVTAGNLALASVTDNKIDEPVNVPLQARVRQVMKEKELLANVVYKNANGDTVGAFTSNPIRLLPLAAKEDKVQLNLILFDFGKSELGPMNARVMEFLNSILEDRFKITVEGHTDRVGLETTNQKISESRAQTAAKGVKRTPNSVKGVGEASPLHTNELPEGRMYNRTVQFDLDATGTAP